jgi:hypothetical protein
MWGPIWSAGALDSFIRNYRTLYTPTWELYIIWKRGVGGGGVIQPWRLLFFMGKKKRCCVCVCVKSCWCSPFCSLMKNNVQLHTTTTPWESRESEEVPLSRFSLYIVCHVASRRLDCIGPSPFIVWHLHQRFYLRQKHGSGNTERKKPII